ncbi:MAG TPA: ATP-binding protein [Streptosporangiaceae bacterium]|nr:ATP-binding protein [Streptosporangiaceae bacterium]
MTGQPTASPLMAEVGGLSPAALLHSVALRADSGAHATEWVGQPAATYLLGTASDSVGSGRQFVRDTLREWCLGDLTDVAELVASELVTNALRHGLPSARRSPIERPVRLGLLGHAPYVLCTVTDPGCALPVLREVDLAAESGRGLTVVDACSVRWGWHPLDEGGKVVWALLR